MKKLFFLYWKQSISILCFNLILVNTSCKKPGDISVPVSPTKVQINFKDKVGNNDLVLNTQKYVSLNSDTFVVETLKYYISNFTFTNTVTGIVLKIPSYCLINHGLKDSTVLDSFPAGQYHLLQFGIGVDSSHNHRIDYTGDLDPNNDMAWTWKTGYKFMVLEGLYSSETNKKGALVFHVGDDANYKVVTIPIQEFNVSSGSRTTINLKTDVNAMFAEPYPIDFDTTNNIQQGIEAGRIAANYANGMFSLLSMTKQ